PTNDQGMTKRDSAGIRHWSFCIRHSFVIGGAFVGIRHLRRGNCPAVIDVALERVDLPERAVRVAEPKLGLSGITTLDPLLALRPDARALEPLLHGDQRGRVAQAKAKMIERPAR